MIHATISIKKKINKSFTASRNDNWENACKKELYLAFESELGLQYTFVCTCIKKLEGAENNAFIVDEIYLICVGFLVEFRTFKTIYTRKCTIARNPYNFISMKLEKWT